MSRKTSQKRLIEKEIKNIRYFFDAEKLYQQISKKNSKIGIATIYRFLKTLGEEEKIHSYTCDRKTIYSSNTKNHCHFTCEKCGIIKHITLKKLDFIQEKMEGNLCHFQIDITGVCKRCQKIM